METAYVGVGANIEPEKNILEALRRLLPEGLTRVSTVYRTEPVNAPGEPFFYNCVAELKTGRPPAELKYSVLRPVEEALGRRRGTNKHSARPIDLDLIVYGTLEVNSEGLILPDEEICTRSHLAIPLFELAPALVLPGGRLLRVLAESLGSKSMERLDGYTGFVRRSLFG
mgnify:FL=1